jgi:CheY-like chemotaxis protein
LKCNLSGGCTKVVMSQQAAGMNIVIVDDEEDLCSLFQLLVKTLGYKTEFIGHDGKEIVDAVLGGRVSPGLIIMDYRMPTMNGIQAADTIRRVKSDTKIILATADDSVKGEAISPGLYYIQKPFSIQALKSIVEKVVREFG